MAKAEEHTETKFRELEACNCLVYHLDYVFRAWDLVWRLGIHRGLDGQMSCMVGVLLLPGKLQENCLDDLI